MILQFVTYNGLRSSLIISTPRCTPNTSGDFLQDNQSYFANSSRKFDIYKTLYNYKALIIGINKYEYFPTLETVDETKTLTKVLIEKYGFTANLLLDATGDTIHHSLYKVAQMARENDSILIYYSGYTYRSIFYSSMYSE